MRQEDRFTPKEVTRILGLLKTTDMTIREIAARMECSRTVIIVINNKYNARSYLGKRNRWVVNYELPEATV